MNAEKTGTYLAILRKTQGMTQQETADRLGVSNKTVSKWESGGGFPDITVLPALAELYGVTADDILAGETLTDRRRDMVKENTAAQKKRLLVRLRTRFDVCFALSLALAVVALFGIPYASLAALPLSVAAVWAGYVLVAHPIRYGDVEGDTGLWEDLYRKLLIAFLLQEWALLRFIHFGKGMYIDPETRTFHYDGDEWKPAVFCAGVLVLLWVLEWSLRRIAGAEARLLPGSLLVRTVTFWLLWGMVFWILWQKMDRLFQDVLAPWVEKYGEGVLTDPRFDTIWPKAKAQRDAELLPLLWRRRAVLAAGAISGLGLLLFQLRGLLRRKKQSRPLAEPRE